MKHGLIYAVTFVNKDGVTVTTRYALPIGTIKSAFVSLTEHLNSEGEKVISIKNLGYVNIL